MLVACRFSKHRSHSSELSGRCLRSRFSRRIYRLFFQARKLLKAGRVSLNVRLYDPTTGDLAKSETFENLVTGFAFVKQNRVWDQHVSIVRQNQTRVTVVIEAR